MDRRTFVQFIVAALSGSLNWLLGKAPPAEEVHIAPLHWVGYTYCWRLHGFTTDPRFGGPEFDSWHGSPPSGDGLWRVTVDGKDMSHLPIFYAREGSQGHVHYHARDTGGEWLYLPDGRLILMTMTGEVVVEYLGDDVEPLSRTRIEFGPPSWDSEGVLIEQNSKTLSVSSR